MASSAVKVEYKDSKPLHEDEHQESLWFESVTSDVLRFFRPFAPQFIPLFVCLALIPVVIFFSLFSGWYVWKNVAMGWESPLCLQYGDGGSPYVEMELPSLAPSQPYDISIHLVIPASEANFALGNFMVALTLSTPSNKTLMSVRKPAIVLPPTKSRISWLTSPPRLVNLDIPVLQSHAPGASRVIARVELGRRDGWRTIGSGEGRELSIFSASLSGTIKRRGIRGFVTRFPVLAAAASSATFLVISLLVLAACILPAVQWHFPSRVTEPTGNIELRAFRKRRQRRKVSPTSEGTSQSGYKTEDIAVDIPPAVTLPDQPLRRRRSKASDAFYDSEP